jgi:hypothetical protein
MKEPPLFGWRLALDGLLASLFDATNVTAWLTLRELAPAHDVFYWPIVSFGVGAAVQSLSVASGHSASRVTDSWARA